MLAFALLCVPVGAALKDYGAFHLAGIGCAAAAFAMVAGLRPWLIGLGASCFALCYLLYGLGHGLAAIGSAALGLILWISALRQRDA